MAREGLMLPLRAAINKAKKENKTARKENVRVNQNGKTRTVNLEVIPLKNLRERCFLILFEDAEKVGRPSQESVEPRGGLRPGRPIAKRKNPTESGHSKPSFPTHAITCNPSRNSTKPPTRNSRRRTKKSSPPTKNSKASTKNWKPPRKSWSRPTKS
jgi:hypothetical protein